jgi:AcrR family transcriptional regulator
MRSLTDRSINGDRRRQILDAAVRVFAQKGYHTCRVGDIAAEAGVAYGLLYHYFPSKEAVLETIFRDTWTTLLERVKAIEESGEPASAQLRHVAAILLRSWRVEPDTIRVLVREVARSSHLQEKIDEFDEARRALERIIERGTQDGSFRCDLDTRLASYVFYGAIEEIYTAWALGRLPDDEESVARAERTIVEVVVGGLAAAPAGVPA